MIQKRTAILLLTVLAGLSLLLAACGTPPGPAATAPTAASSNNPVGYPAATESSAGNASAPAYPPAENLPAAVPTPENAYPSPEQVSGQSGLQLVKPDGSTATLAQADLSKIPAAQATIGDKVENGIPLTALLDSAGVSSYQQVIITGASSLTLNKDQVTPDVILILTPDGTFNLAGSKLAADQWVNNVTRIEAK